MSGADASAERDCSPVMWTNPGGIKAPQLKPIASDAGETKTAFDQSAGMTEFNYEMQEFLISSDSRAYTTRLVVRRPSDPKKFSGTVFVEWYNVSGGLDMAVEWASSRDYFMREGHGYVAVSAQAAGADFLKQFDATRYAEVNHPGDTASAEIFSQTGVAIRSQGEQLFGPCMPVHAVIAMGQSQSAARLSDYVDNTQKSAQVYDGFLLHAGGEPMSTEIAVPTFVVFTMSEGNGTRADGPNLVKWVVAGATHVDDRMMSRGLEVADSLGGNAEGALGIDLKNLKCSLPMNDHPSFRAYNAVLDWLNRWVRKAEKPPAGNPFETIASDLKLDQHGNVLGGIRSPELDVPYATYARGNSSASLDFVALLACGLGGSTERFSMSKLQELYPTHDDYVQKYTAAADAALAAGHMLQADYDAAIEQAKQAQIPTP